MGSTVAEEKTTPLGTAPQKDGASGPAGEQEIVEILRGFVRELSERERAVLEGRILTTGTVRIRELGERFAVSAQRVHQIEARLRRDLSVHTHKAVGKCIHGLRRRRLLFHLERTESVNRVLEDLLPGEDTAAMVARDLLRTRLGYREDGHFSINEKGEAYLAEFREHFLRAADDMRLVALDDYLEMCGTGRWQRYSPQVEAYLSIERLTPDIVCMSPKNMSRVKAALLEIGRPATCMEISRTAGVSLPLVRRNVSSYPNIVRVDKRRWTFADRAETLYTGIADTLRAEIEAQGGSADVRDLLSTLPDRLSVTRKSVEAYMQTRGFRIADGRLYVVPEDQVQMRPLDDVIDGRTGGAEPYWEFEFTDRWDERNKALTNVPPEFIVALGGEADETVHVTLDTHPGCALSASWTVSSTNAGVIGQLRKPLHRIKDLCEGDRVRIIVSGHRRARLERAPVQSG